MGIQTANGITWCQFTWNPWWGCTEVSPACDHCYAKTLANRYGTGWGNDAETRRRFFGDKHWNEPLKWNRKAESQVAAGGPRPKVFCASMADVFETLPAGHPDRERMNAERTRLRALIEATPNLVWLILTKRPNLAAMYWPVGWSENAWIGTTVENPQWAYIRVPQLLQVPARKRFLSMEPLFGFVDLSCWLDRIDWIITGGESGPHARPAHPAWYECLRDQATDAGVPFHFKQWGEWAPAQMRELEECESVRSVYVAEDGETYAACSAGTAEQALTWLRSKRGRAIPVYRFGKHAAGRTLCGRTWDECPDTREMILMPTTPLPDALALLQPEAGK